MINQILRNVATTVTLSVAVMTAVLPTLANATPIKKTNTQTVALTAENTPLANDIIAFNNAMNATAMKSQNLQKTFIETHQNDNSPDVQVLFIKEGLKSLEQQKADLQAVNLTDPQAIAMREKFINTINLQKSAYAFMVNTPKPTQAEQDKVANQMVEVQTMGEEAINEFLQLAKQVGLQPSQPTQ